MPVGCGPEDDVTLTLKATAVPDVNEAPFAGEVILKIGVGNIPDPERVTVSAPLTVLSSSVSVACLAPVAEGVKITPILHVWPFGNEAPGVSIQVVVVGSILKSVEFVPVIATFVRIMYAFPVLLTVTNWGALAVPLLWFAKTTKPWGPTLRKTCADPVAAELLRMYTPPWESTPTPVGLFNVAEVARDPSPVYPAVPVPAIVRMIPVL